jgi:hypothetical protein
MSTPFTHAKVYLRIFALSGFRWITGIIKNKAGAPRQMIGKPHNLKVCLSKSIKQISKGD